MTALSIDQILTHILSQTAGEHAAGVQAYQALDTGDIPAIHEVVSAMPMQRGGETVQWLTRIESPIRCDLMADLALSQNPLVASHAIDYLSTLGEDCVDILVRIMPEASTLVLMKILNVFNVIRSHRAVGPLVELLDVVDSPSIRHQIIEVLGMIGDLSTIPAIRPYLNDDDRHVHKRAQAAIQIIERRHQAGS